MPLEGLAPSSGPVGTEVSVMFPQGTSADTFTILMNSLVAAKGVSYSTGDIVPFTVPASLAPDCKPNAACPDFLLHVSPGVYQVAVLINDAGSPVPVGDFSVTESAGT
jgi:hypothetical protein